MPFINLQAMLNKGDDFENVLVLKITSGFGKGTSMSHDRLKEDIFLAVYVPLYCWFLKKAFYPYPKYKESFYCSVNEQ